MMESKPPIAIPGRPALSLVMLAGVTLFLELAFIRWASANVIYLGYFSNFVLMACFLGIGLGFLTTKRKVNLLPYAAPVLGLVCFGINALQTTIQLGEFGIDGRIYFNTGSVLVSPAPVWLTLTVLFVGISAMFTCISQATGRCFAYFEPIRAYTWDIFGSLLGIAFFTIMSFLWTPAWLWFVIGGLLLLVLNWSGSNRDRIVTFLAAGLAVFAVAASDVAPEIEETIWSPYQQLSVQNWAEDHVVIRANRVPHQDLTHIDKYEIGRDIPWQVAEEAGVDVKEALIIGAGSGTDVAEALSRGVHVTAVEIDPAIADIGKRRHPNKPYDSENVDLNVNDGRAFMEQTDKKFDFILFALPDSLALYSSYSSVRLESFLFTKEALTLAKERLNPGGILILYNDYRADSVVSKLSTMLEDVFGVKPVYRTPKNSKLQVLVAGDGVGNLKSDQTFERVEEDLVPTDDWPFLYMEARTLPSIYLILILGILAVTFISVFFLAPKGTLRKIQLPFFFMGAAFLLLETKSIIQFSLLFGTTWLVNSLVFGGVLVMVLLANLLVSKFEIRTVWPFYILLALLILANYLVPISTFAELPTVARYVAASLLLLAPIFAANIIFSGTFASSEESDTSFGWNILGTMVGGSVENLSVVIGYHHLALVVAVFYALAFITDRMRRG